MSTIIVTGAASGMGRACVDRVRGLADVVVAVDLREPQIEGAVGMACDIADPAQVAELAEAAAGTGLFRGLIHAAGLSPTMADPRRIFEVDLLGTQLLLDAFEERLAPGSAAVCFASMASYQIEPFVNDEHRALLEDPRAPDFLDRGAEMAPDSGLAYGLAKFGVRRAVERAAVRWGRGGGRVNSVSPGIIETPMGRREMAEQPMMQSMLDSTPLGRMGRAEEVAAVAAFLVSDDAAYVTGIDVRVDGGTVAATTAPPPA